MGCGQARKVRFVQNEVRRVSWEVGEVAACTFDKPPDLLAVVNGEVIHENLLGSQGRHKHFTQTSKKCVRVYRTGMTQAPLRVESLRRDCSDLTLPALRLGASATARLPLNERAYSRYHLGTDAPTFI